jgi:hypothetical protein
MHVAPPRSTTIRTRIKRRVAVRLIQIETEPGQEHAYLARTGTPAETIMRGATKLVALAEELCTLTESAKEAEKLEPRVLVI